MDEIILLPKIRKIKENMKKINSSTQTPPKSDLVSFKEKVTAVIKPVNVLENKIESNKKSATECDMGYCWRHLPSYTLFWSNWPS